MHDEASIGLMSRFIEERPDLWYEDIAGNGIRSVVGGF